MSANLASLLYLVSGVLFILALRGLSSPETSRQGNYMGMAGIFIGLLLIDGRILKRWRKAPSSHP